jgi:hypothetical protein
MATKGTEGKVTRKPVRKVVAPRKAQRAAGSAAAAQTPTHDEIAVRAYEIYLDEGQPEGRADEHWQRAEAELMARLGV